MSSNYSSFGFGYDSDSQYDVAQICMSGHVVNDATKKFPQFSSKYCRKCGHPTIEQCPDCQVPIKGRYHSSTAPTVTSTKEKESPVPFYCHDCGKAYPWTQALLDTALELINEEDNLTAEDKSRVAESIRDIITPTPRTSLAATRIKKAYEKMSAIGKEGFKQLLFDNTTESARRLIWTP